MTNSDQEMRTDSAAVSTTAAMETMTTILVSSTESGTGKTAITIALARLAQERGLDVGYMKPKGTRPESTVGKTRDEDPMLARAALDLDAEIHEMEPIVYSPTFVSEALRGKHDPEELRERITEAFEELAAETDLMVLEGGDRLWTGGIVELTDVDVAEAVDADVLLVSQYTDPGSLDDVLAATDAIGDRLRGVLFNDVTESAYDELVQAGFGFLDAREIDSLGAIAHDHELGGVTVDELAGELGGELLTPDVSTAERIERFSVGAMGASQALRTFRRLRDAAVITGGDRADMQTNALEASGVRCLVLTGGIRPPGTVLGKATEREVPVLLVQTDTRTTVDRMERILRSGRVQRVETVERMAALLEESVEVDRLLGTD